jgi:hypothetical protein
MRVFASSVAMALLIATGALAQPACDSASNFDPTPIPH